MQVTSEESTFWSGLPQPQPATYLILRVRKSFRKQERSLKEFGEEFYEMWLGKVGITSCFTGAILINFFNSHS